jgi:hypothetical protein
MPTPEVHPGESPVIEDLVVSPSAAPARNAFTVHAAERSIGEANVDGVIRMSPAGRKAYAVMKVVSAVMLAVAVSPGGDSDDASIDEATRALLARASDLAEAAMPLLGERVGSEDGAVMRNQLRQYAAETVSLQWRLAHSTGHKDLSVEQIMRVYQQVDESALLRDVNVAESSSLDGASIDAVISRRLAIVTITTELHNAVGNFAYLHPEPVSLVEAGVRTVVRVADDALARLLPAGQHDETTQQAFSQAFLERAGTLYAQNWRSIARKDVQRISEMDPQERLRFVHENRVGGMPTAHIDAAYEVLMSRLVALVLEVAPDAEPQGIPTSRADAAQSTFTIPGDGARL